MTVFSILLLMDRFGAFHAVQRCSKTPVHPSALQFRRRNLVPVVKKLWTALLQLYHFCVPRKVKIKEIHFKNQLHESVIQQRQANKSTEMQEFSFNKDTPLKEQFNARSTHFSLVTHLSKHGGDHSPSNGSAKALYSPFPFSEIPF